MSMTQAARTAGINATHSVVKKLMLNPRYLGDEFYPAILTPEITQAVETGRWRRNVLFKGTRYTREDAEIIIPTSFTMRKFSQKYKDPVKQAEYAYSLIDAIENTESEVK